MAAAPGEVVGEDTGAPVDGEKGEPVEEAEEARDEALYEDEPPREEIEWTPNTKLRRISEVDVAAQPLSYRANTKKEELALAHVANFERQYIDLYPSRKPLLLCPINECGIPKFVCTTLRPSQLQFKQLYDYDKCAAFVSDYIRFERLELPTMLPRHMPSPAAVLRWQAGDCFDMSMLLCSLLLGVGYDAYVVVGYAHKKVTLCDQTDKPVNDAGRSGAAELASGSGGNKYVIQRRQPLESKFDKDAKLEQEDAEAKARAKAQREAELEFGEDPEREEDMDELRGKRVHAWVLLLAGKRELPDNFFVEATTGVCYRLDAAAPPPYYGVESIFNASNYWTNMQPGALHAHDLAWDLHDTACWEHVFVDPPASAVLEGMAGLGLEDIEAADDDDDDLVDTSPPTPARAPSQTAGEAEEGARPAETAEAAEAAGGDGAVPVSRAQSAAAHAPPLDAGTADEQAPSEPAAIDPDTLLDMPPSWVRRLALTPAQLESRCPGREKEVAYKAGALQKWAPYARDDGLVARITLYSDLERTQAAEVHERFEQRKDRLALRVTKVDASVVLEEFLPGRPFGLKENELEAGVRRRMRFLPAARLDGLQMREEHFGRKTIETYVGRDDRLVYRSVTFDEASAASAALVAGAKDAEPAIVKMAEKYARNDELDAALDVAKRVYDVRAGSIHVTYHLGPGHITAPSRTFFKEAWPPAVTLTDPFAKRPADAALREEYQALVTAERECLQAFREQERQMKEILKRREAEEAAHELLFSVYDTARQRHYLDAERKDDAATAAVMHDYLTPFLPNPKSTEPLDREAALKVREACLKSLRDRLVERATIIQSRLDEENANLAKKTSTFSRNRDHADKQTEEEYERYCQAAMFRIQIIDERLKRHEKQALQKYEEMDARLRADPRMRALLHG